MSKLKTLAGETVLYGLGNILPKTINFFLVAIHTRIFLPAEYGVFTYISAIVAFVNIVYTFGLETAFFRFSTKPGADPKKVFDQVQTLVLCISIPLSVVFILFANPIAVYLKAGAHPEIIIWISLLMLIDASVAIPFAQLRLKKKPLKYASAKIFNIVLIVALNFYFLKLNFNPAVGIAYIFIANLIANSFYLLFFASELLSWRPSFDGVLSSALFRYGWPVMLGGLAYIANEMFSRVLLEHWLPKDFYGPDSREAAVGIFGACYKYAMLMNLAIQAFRFAAEPFFFSNAADKNSPALFARVNHYFVIVCCVILLGVSINMDVLKHLLGGLYFSGISIVPILLLGYLFLGVYYNFSIWYKVSDKTYYGTIFFAGGAVLTVVLNYFLIPIWGYTGSSWATLLVYFLMAASCYLVGQRHYPIPYRIAADASYIIITVALVVVFSLIPIGNLWVAVLFHNGVILVLAATVYLLEKKNLKVSNS